MKRHWWHFTWAIGSFVLGELITQATGEPIFVLTGLVVAMILTMTGLFLTIDPDPAYLSVPVSDEEAVLANKRLRWVDQTVRDLCQKAGIRPLKTTHFANSGIYYKPLWNRVMISRALCARLSEADLHLILAHEIGHATRRYKVFGTFRESVRIAEELHADTLALQLTGFSADCWLRALQASIRAEGYEACEREICLRMAALGVSVAGHPPTPQ